MPTTTTRWSDEEVEAFARHRITVLEEQHAEILADLEERRDLTADNVARRHNLGPDSTLTIADIKQLCDTYSIGPLAKRSTRDLWLKHAHENLTRYKLDKDPAYQDRKKRLADVRQERLRVERLLAARQELHETNDKLTATFTTEAIDGWACQRLSTRLSERARLEWVWYATRIWMSNLADGRTWGDALAHAKERAVSQLELPGSGQYGHRFYAESVHAGMVEFIQGRGWWF